MNEIEKLYENVKIYDFRYDCDVSFTDGQFGRITNCSKGEVKDYCTDKKYFKSAKVINYKRLHPPFTASKQLELIKWLGKLDMIEIMKTVGEDKAWIISSRYDISEGIYHYASRNKSFEEALARLINQLWQDLTSEEKEQVREILNG